MGLRIQKMFYAATGTNYYGIIVKQGNGYALSYGDSGLFEANPTRPNQAISAPEFTGSGRYKLNVPDDLVGGNYDYVLYERAGGSPAASDTLIESFKFSAGGILGF